jgi:LacI family transcriptional regulator
MRRIGVFVHPWHTFGREILRGLSHYAAKHADWEWYCPWSGRRDWARLPKLHLDGVIVRVGTTLDPEIDFASHLPRVVISGHAEPGVDLHWDNRAIGRLAAEHLIEQGHHRLFFVHQHDTPYQLERGEGFRMAADDGVREVRIIRVDITQPREVEAVVAGQPRTSGIAGATDEIAKELLLAARHLKREVPRDLAIMGIGDDEEFCELNSPTLSSVSLPGVKLGYEAALLLEKILAGEYHPRKPIAFAPAFVTPRESTDLLAVDDPLILEILTFIRDRAANGISVSDILASAPLSRRALEIRFRRVVGRSIDDELRRVRVQRAQRLLHTTEMSMAEVASRAGFPSPQRLTAVFTRMVGESPTTYRARLRGTHGVRWE